MRVEHVYVGEPPERLVGQVFTRMRLVNGRDLILAEEGLRAPEDVRAVELSTVLVDTGATTLSLPTEIIEQLGLRPWREVGVETASGPHRTRIYRYVVIQIDDREGEFQCVELPGGGVPLLGVVPLEMLGFEPDLKHQRLKKLPMDDTGSYLTIY